MADCERNAKNKKIRKTITNLWDFKCPINEKNKTEQVCFSEFVKQHNYLIPDEISTTLAAATDEYTKDNFEKSEELIVDAEILLNSHLGIKKSQEEIKERFKLLSK